MFSDEYFDTPSVRENKSVPVMRIIAKLDELEGKRDIEGAERHLKYWLAEAESAGDEKGQFAICSEIMGFYRKAGKRDKAVEAAERTLSLGRKLNLEGSEAFGTALLNAATVYKAFGENAHAQELFDGAVKTLEEKLDGSASKMGGLYNNMALNLTDLNRFDEAERAYKKAIVIMAKNKWGELECAISYLNLANLYEKRDGLEDADEAINECLKKAQELLETPSLPRDGYYAFVCEKCAPTFAYYGAFYYAEQLEKTADEIYERNRNQ